MVIEKKRKKEDTKKEEGREKKLSPSAIFFLLTIMGQRGEDKDKYSRPVSGQKARKMTPMDSGAAFHYLVQSIHSLPLDGPGPRNTLSFPHTAYSGPR